MWIEPHRDQVRAENRAAVKRVLRKRGVRETDFEPFIARFMEQAEAQYAEWRSSPSLTRRFLVRFQKLHSPRRHSLKAA